VVRWFHWLGLVWFGWVLLPAGALASGAQRNQDLAASSAFFSNVVVYRIQIQIAPEDLARLRKDQHRFVRATVKEGGKTYEDVGVHLKGSAGSFRPIDDPKPGFTLSFSKFVEERKFHGTRKIHLNNCVQDGSYVNENLAGELFRAAGVPAARVTYALVEVNGRKMGLYVVKEGITKDFLAPYFKKTSGNLYDMEGGREVTEQMKRESGGGPLDWADLKALAAAAQEPDPTQRWQRLDRLLDLDRFLSFMAMEMITCHWDGYCIGRNNFRIYHDMDTDKLVFLPHGMDQMFRDPNFVIGRPGFSGLVAQMLIRTPEGRRRYRERVANLITNVFKIEMMTNRVNQLVAQIRPTLAAFDPNAARSFDDETAAVRSRLIQCAASYEKFLRKPEPKPLAFDGGIAKLTNWRIPNEPVGAKLDRPKEDGKEVLRIHATGKTVASWRAQVLLPAGRYRLEGLARTTGVVSIKDEKKGEGAGLRVSGSQQPRSNKLLGDNSWQSLVYEFEVAAPSDEAELICELRATEGEAWFDLGSLHLTRITSGK